MVTTYRSVSRKGHYKLEAITGSHHRTIANYLTEHLAVMRLHALQAMAEADHRMRSHDRRLAARRASNGR